MLTSVVTIRKPSAAIRDINRIEIEAYIQGAVYSFCGNCDGWFSAKTLFGGDNRDWTGTPLMTLYEWHEANGSVNPVNMAGRDIGWLLLKVIKQDARLFDTQKVYTREYRWKR